MSTDKIWHFVCFETTLGSEQFIKRWEEFTHSENSNADVTLQQSEKNGVFSYIAQHRRPVGELRFIFEKSAKSSRIPQVEIKAKQAGGYSLLKAGKTKVTNADESKIFAFITDARADMSVYGQLPPYCKLNIYEAYYENCQYAYILELFVGDSHAAELMERLKQYNVTEIGIYKECVLQTA
ncbi:MAG TPA: hypothetical protein PL045_09545 [Chitinophagaceae bacterium]|nr:hypothetical protein [Chitinophagaceae bacterium]